MKSLLSLLCVAALIATVVSGGLPGYYSNYYGSPYNYYSRYYGGLPVAPAALAAPLAPAAIAAPYASAALAAPVAAAYNYGLGYGYGYGYGYNPYNAAYWGLLKKK